MYEHPNLSTECTANAHERIGKRGKRVSLGACNKKPRRQERRCVARDPKNTLLHSAHSLRRLRFNTQYHISFWLPGRRRLGSVTWRVVRVGDCGGDDARNFVKLKLKPRKSTQHRRPTNRRTRANIMKGKT